MKNSEQRTMKMLTPVIPPSGIGAPPVPMDVFNMFGINGTASGGSWLGWAGLILPIAFAGLFMATSVYMLGIALNLSHVKQWAKGELVQVVLTVILAVALVSLASVGWLFMNETIKYIYESSNPQVAALQPGAYYDPFAFDQLYIANTFLDCQVRIYRTLYWVNYYYKFVGKVSTEIIGADAAGSWFASAYSGVMDYTMQHLDRLVLLHYIQYRFLSLIKYAMPLLFLIGLLLRIFPLTRGTGGMLMAMGFGFFFVYPVSLALLMAIQPAPPVYCSQFAPPPMLSGANTCWQDAGDYYSARYSVLASENGVKKIFSDLEIFLPYFYMQALFVPLVAFTITFTVFRQVGALFGADLNEVGRGLVKLI